MWVSRDQHASLNAGEDIVGRPLRRHLRDAGRNAELTVAIQGNFLYQCLDLRG